LSEGIRLNKALADAGVCSRRKADELIFAGQVTVNGKSVSEPGLRVFLDDRLCIAGKPVTLARGKEPCWLMLNKPIRVLCTVSDPEGRETVLDFVPSPWRERRLYPVGRLDYFSEGLILLTDDGDMAFRLAHPRWHLPKIYHVLVHPDGGDLRSALAEMRRGMTLSEGEQIAPVECRILSQNRGILLEMVLHQGLNRQIRRMCRDTGLTVLRLRRVTEGPLFLDDLPVGAVRPLSLREMKDLRRAVGLV